MNMENLDKHVCAVQEALTGKWKIVILAELNDGVKRFNELQRALVGIRQAYLTQQLRELEADGLIHREVYREVPPKVEYSLTEIGMKFRPVLEAMFEFGAEYNKYLASLSPLPSDTKE